MRDILDRVRVDLVVIGVMTAAILLLFAGVADHGFARAPTGVPTDLAPLATVAPRPSPTGGWWEEITMTPPPLPPLPRVPSAGSLGLSAGGSDPLTGGQPVPFTVVSCPRGDVKISRIATSNKPNWWDISGTAAIPNQAYWKGELSVDGQGWLLLYKSNLAVQDGLLIQFNTRTVARGVYQLRLTAVDNTGNYPEPCTVRVEVR